MVIDCDGNGGDGGCIWALAEGKSEDEKVVVTAPCIANKEIASIAVTKINPIAAVLVLLPFRLRAPPLLLFCRSLSSVASHIP